MDVGNDCPLLISIVAKTPVCCDNEPLGEEERALIFFRAWHSFFLTPATVIQDYDISLHEISIKRFTIGLE